MTWLFEPGLFASAPVRTAFAVGAVAAVVSAAVGLFTVVRGQSFAGHALTDVSTAGGSGAVLFGLNPLLGFVTLGVISGGLIDLIGLRRVRDRDLSTGVVLGAAIGLAALTLYLDSTRQDASGAAQEILFGSIFSLGASVLPYVAGLGAGVMLGVATMYRPLLLSTVSGDVAAAHGVRVRLVSLAFMTALAVSVGLSALVVGAVLSTALLIGPAAAAVRLSRRFGWCLVIGSVIGVGATWLGVVLAYDSYYWGGAHRGWPVSFFVVALVTVAYLLAGLRSAARRG